MLCCEMVGRSRLLDMIAMFLKLDLLIGALIIAKSARNGIGQKLAMLLPRGDDKDDDIGIGVSGRSGSTVMPLVGFQGFCNLLTFCSRCLINFSSNYFFRSEFYLGFNILHM